MTTPIELRIFPIQGATYRESLSHVAEQWSALWRANRSPIRLVSVVHPFSFAPLRQQLQEQAVELEQAVLANDTRGFAYAWSIDQRAMLDKLERDMPPLTVDHYLVCWPASVTERETLAERVRASFGLPAVVPCPLPRLLPGVYEPRLTHLQPIDDPSLPLARILIAFKVSGTWDPTSWMKLLYGDIPLALCIDITTVSREKVKATVQRTKSRLRVAAYGKNAADDQDARDGYEAATQMQQMLRRDNLHMVTYAILLQGRDVRELDQAETHIKTTLAGQLELEALPGAQRTLARFFTPKRTSAIHAPTIAWNTPSTGLGHKLPWLIDKTASNTGVVWGIGETKLPMVRDIIHEAARNINGVVLGKSGSGKTTALLTLLGRLSTAPHNPFQSIFVAPHDHGRLLTDMIGDDRAGKYYDVSGDACVNVLDRIHDNPEEQAFAVRRKLSLIMGTVEVSSDEVIAHPRPFNEFEWPAIDLALQLVYGKSALPLLHDLADALDTVIKEHGIDEARGLQRALALALKTGWAEKFDRPTTLHWDFGPQVLAYSFDQVPKERWPLYYALVFEAMDHYVRTRTTTQPVLAVVDELGYMAQVPDMLDYARRSTKTWRNKWGGFMGCDQDPSLFIDDPAGRAIWANAHWKLIGFLDPVPARYLASHLGDQLPVERVETITTAQKGQFIGIWGTEVSGLYISPTGMEWQALIAPRDQRKEEDHDPELELTQP